MNDTKPSRERSRVRAVPDATPPARSGVVALDGSRLRDLIVERLPRRASELRERWPCHEAGNSESLEPPHRATIHRWTQGQMPRTKDDLLRLCGILDVDPMCLLSLPEHDSEATMERLSTAYLHGRWDPPALEFLNSFLGRRTMWPPTWLSRDFFARDWHVREFEHDPAGRINYYATLRIDVGACAYPNGPLVYHVAYRHRALFGMRWLQYGVVQRDGNRVKLLHINGFTETCRVDAGTPMQVQTWLGPGAAVFRVASLHPFALDVADQVSDDEPIVRFPG